MEKAKIDPLLVKIQDDISSRVSPKNKQAFEKANIAVEKIMFDPKTHANMQMVKYPERVRRDVVLTLSTGISGMMNLLFVQSGRKMDPEVLIMSGVIAMTLAVDFAQRGLGIPVTPEQIAKITKISMENMFQKMGISPEMLNEEIAKGKKEIDDYQKHQGFLDQKIAALRPKKA